MCDEEKGNEATGTSCEKLASSYMGAEQSQEHE